MKYRSNSILAHIPQNLEGKRILKHVCYFQEALQLRVFLFDFIASSSFFATNPNSKRNQIRHQGALNKFTDFIKKALDKDIPGNTMLRIGLGKAITTLIQESERGGYEFVIVDKTGKTRSNLLSTSDLDRYISKSYCPVLSINHLHPINEVKKIIIPIDITQRTKKRLYWATFFAKKLGAKIQIVSAISSHIKKNKSLAQKNAQKIKEMLEERGVKCEVKIITIQNDDKISTIIEHINKEQPQMVIIRTHQEFKFTGRRVGKFVSEIVHACPMPVFTVGGKSQTYDLDSI